MILKEKLQLLRKDRNLSQEDIAERLSISRQAVAKWEAGQTLPDIDNIVKLSELFGVTIDAMLKDDSGCAQSLIVQEANDTDRMIEFLLDAKKKTYAGNGKEEKLPSRPNSHDLIYKDGEYTYIDTYLGGERFTGEEGVWIGNQPTWSMNYSGRVLHERFSGTFLKEALSLVPVQMPFRGPNLYKNGDYTYYCATTGDFQWYQGNEEIFYSDVKVYECFFHGGVVK
jgi:transcriptional regulator with XRE-family HTH domain